MLLNKGADKTLSQSPLSMINKSIADEMEFEDTLYRLQMENNNKQEITTNGKYQQTGNNIKWLIITNWK